MQITRVFDLLTNLEQICPDKPDMLSRRVHGQWIKFSTKEYVNSSHSVARSLLSLGLPKGTKVISITSNRPEWNFIDMGCALANMVHTPIYPTLSADDFLYIFNHSDAEVIFIGNEILYKKIYPVVEQLERKVKVVLIDDCESQYCFKQFLQEGEKNREALEAKITENIANTDKDEFFSLIYTSGTTGRPKGVMLSHYNLVFDSHSHAIRQTYNSSHKMISFLPLCHVYERTMNYEYQELGISIYYAENIGTFASDLADCHADGFCAVPRVLEMMYAKLEAAGHSLKGLKKCIYSSAWKYANHYDNYNKKFFYQLRHSLFDKLVYSKWRANLGGRNLLVVSGGSAIQEKIVRCFNAANFSLNEGYGMTETSPVISVNNPRDGINIFGTVGTVIDDTTLKFADDGEILVKGPHVMLGYYKDPEQTAQIIDSDGFLHTGDIGVLIEGKYLKITDRKKEIFKLSNGKYIAPLALETKLKGSDFIQDCMVVGENQKFPSAIIIPEMNKLIAYAKAENISFTDNDDLLSKEKIQKKLHSEVTASNASLAAHEQIKKEVYINDEWTTANNMLSQTLKLKRAKIYERYKDIIEDIFK